MKIYKYKDLSKERIDILCSRQGTISKNIIDIVDNISKDIIKDGDNAIRELTQKFDGILLERFAVNDDEIEKSANLVPDEVKSAIIRAKDNIFKFHEQQVEAAPKKIETSKGIFCWRKFKAIENVGLYIPGGTAPLFSTVLMLIIPAILAGSKRIVICTPPNNEGKIAPEILWTANMLGVTEIYKVGGAQAIFAMSYGTKQISKVDKIFGPGNAFVTAAKMKISSRTAIDMPAGPSEVLVIADKNSNAAFVASDILSQAEHGTDSQAVLLCDCSNKIDEIIAETDNQLEQLPRKDIAKQALSISYAVKIDNMKEAFEYSNIYAPEHLILSLDDFEQYIDIIENAGSVFCGKYSSESFGDYASGTNHTLPTSGFAKSYSGVSVSAFGKWITFQEVTKQGLNDLGETVEIMADREGLFAHKNAVTIRKNS